ncbi:MAG: hypothetical protein ACKVZH_15260 [Blastocatellia bacterium]
MQINCNRFSCQKAVEVCYWTCKFRRDCKDWHNALAEEPGTEAIAERLKQAAKKNGRAFDAQTMVLTSRGKKNSKNSRAVVVSKTPIANLESASFSTARGEAEFGNQGESHPTNITNINHGEVKVTMTEENLDTPSVEPKAEAAAEAPGKPAAPKAAKPKPVPAKPKPAAQSSGPVFLLLYPNGKYKELRESDLNTEAADVLKDPSLRLVKALPLIPQISFKSPDE